MINNKIRYLFIIFTLFFGFNFVVEAKEVNNTVDFSKKGSIEIVLEEKTDDTAVEGAEVTIYKIADAYNKDYNLTFKYTDEFDYCEVSLDDLREESLSKEITKCVTDDSVGVSQLTNEDGVVLFDELDLGLYLVSQTNKVEGYSNIDSFLVMIPKVIDNSWTYDIEANPKTDIYKVIDITVNKVWNTDDNDLPEKVDIQLYRGDELIDSIVLNRDNNWTHTWKELEKSDNYSVKEVNIPKGYKVTYKNDGYTFVVTNTDTLANTGQLFFSIIILAILGMCFIIVGFIQIKREN